LTLWLHLSSVVTSTKETETLGLGWGAIMGQCEQTADMYRQMRVERRLEQERQREQMAQQRQQSAKK
jgi:hypothetical protein